MKKSVGVGVGVGVAPGKTAFTIRVFPECTFLSLSMRRGHRPVRGNRNIPPPWETQGGTLARWSWMSSLILGDRLSSPLPGKPRAPASVCLSLYLLPHQEQDITHHLPSPRLQAEPKTPNMNSFLSAILLLAAATSAKYVLVTVDRRSRHYIVYIAS